MTDFLAEQPARSLHRYVLLDDDVLPAGPRAEFQAAYIVEYATDRVVLEARFRKLAENAFDVIEVLDATPGAFRAAVRREHGLAGPLAVGERGDGAVREVEQEQAFVPAVTVGDERDGAPAIRSRERQARAVDAN